MRGLVPIEHALFDDDDLKAIAAAVHD